MTHVDLWQLGAGAAVRFAALAVAASGALALAAWVVALGIDRRLHRALALFLVLVGTSYALQALEILAIPQSEYFGRVAPYFLLASPFAALHLGLVYRWPRARGLLAWAVPVALGAGFVGIAALYALDHGTWRARDLLLPGLNLGVLSRWLEVVAYASVGVLLARAAFRETDALRARSLGVAALGFALWAVFYPLHIFVPGLMMIVEERPLVAFAYALALLPTVALLRLLLHHARGSGSRGRADARRFLAVLALPPATVVAIAVARAASYESADAAMNVAYGVWRLALVLLVTYALLKYRLWDIDLRLRRGIRRGTLAAAFMAAFFLASEAAEGVLENHWGPLVGLAAAGALALAGRPLGRAAERVAAAALPGVEPSRDYVASRKESLYAAAFVAALEDGEVSTAERRVLERLREELGLAAEEVARLERAAVARG